jgi:IS605 OrfB family transposase
LWKCNKRKEKGYENVKEPTVPVFKSPFFGVETLYYDVLDDHIKFPIRENGKVRRIPIKAVIDERAKKHFDGKKLGEMKFVYQGRKIVAQIPYEVAEAEEREDGNVMGVDLGLKCPAVSYISDGTVKFYGNGRQNKYIRRRFSGIRKALQEKKHIAVVKRRGDKEQRIMKNIDHHISREIVNDAIEHNVSVIKLENLIGIRKRISEAKKRINRSARKYNRSLYSWSFYRQALYIQYKAKLAGIKVVFVDPAYTSQICPKCGRINKADDRNYVCECGYHVHRDLLGAINICNSTEIVTKGKKKKTEPKAEDAQK